MRVLTQLPILLTLAGCLGGFADPDREFAEPVLEGTLHPVVIHQPLTLGVADTHRLDVNGTPIGVACDTCHGPTPSLSFAAAEGAPDAFHEAVELRHGDLECDYCHDSEDRTQLHLANGQPLDMGDAMTLCAQCHGVQFRDYDRGSHGGMNGYWDLRQGPRSRNHCVDCHAPHAPAYQPVMPVHPPKDRFLNPEEGH